MTEAMMLLMFLTLQRLSELIIANKNTKHLLAAGAKEIGADHYKYMVLLHGSWLIALWVFGQYNDVSRFWLVLFIVLQLGKLWVLGTLRSRWTTRIIILPDAPLVTGGPFRFFKHPNYLVVIGEIAVVPLTLDLWWLALIYTILNAMMLRIRIGVENEGLQIVN